MCTNYQPKSTQTLDIEAMLKDGHAVSDIARWAGVSQQRVSYIKKRLSTPQAVSETSSGIVTSVLKPLTLRLTPSVFDALTEACAITNRKDPDDPITVEDYVNELIINRVVELGLLRKNKRT